MFLCFLINKVSWNPINVAEAICTGCCLVFVSNSLQPYGLQPTRLFCPCEFPGKNTGVDGHFLLQEIFLTQDGTHIACNGRQILYQWATREAWSAPPTSSLMTYLLREKTINHHPVAWANKCFWTEVRKVSHMRVKHVQTWNAHTYPPGEKASRTQAKHRNKACSAACGPVS